MNVPYKNSRRYFSASIARAIKIYISDAYWRVRIIQNAIGLYDIKLLEFEAHALGSAAIMYGNTALYELVRKIEKHCKHGSSDKAVEHANLMLTIVRKSLRVLEACLNFSAVPGEQST